MVDFNRNVHCLLGLPFDAVSLQQAAHLLDRARSSGQRCFMSTPNLNFVVASLSDPAFRESVCRSDLSLADGMPLVWVARLLGIPLRERVSGSGLFDFLRTQSRQNWNVFFFGGPAGVGEKACLALAEGNSSMQAAGHLYPGFADVEQMSRKDWIDNINASNADMLVVSLGSAKGQAWICQNMERLNTPVVSHLGAVINFVAGTVSRAPVWMQRSGLEWLWRVKEEPRLWRRYLIDGSSLLSLLLTRVLPLAILQRVSALPLTEYSRSYVQKTDDNLSSRVSLGGAWDEANLHPVRREFERLSMLTTDVRLDLSDTTFFDSAFVGLLLLLDTALSDQGRSLRLVNVSTRLQRLLRLHGVTHLSTSC